MRLSQEEVQALVAAVPEGYRARVQLAEGTEVNRDGDLEILVGQAVGKPVVRDAATKRLLPGSGRYPKASNSAAVGKANAFKLTKTYREALEQAYTLGPEAGRTFEQLVQMFHEAVDGSPQTVDCPHPEMHTTKADGPRKHLVAFKKDPNAIFKMIELLAGKARETSDVSGQVIHLHKLLDERQTVQVTGLELAPGEAEQRKQDLLEAGVIEEGWFREVTEGEADSANA